MQDVSNAAACEACHAVVQFVVCSSAGRGSCAYEADVGGTVAFNEWQAEVRRVTDGGANATCEEGVVCDRE